MEETMWKIWSDFPGGSNSKEFICSVEPGFDSWVGKIPWRRAWQPPPVFLLGESPWTEEPGGLESMGSQRVGHDWATKHSTCGKHEAKKELRRGWHPWFNLVQRNQSCQASDLPALENRFVLLEAIAFVLTCYTATENEYNIVDLLFPFLQGKNSHASNF